MSDAKYDSDMWPLGCSWVYPRDAKVKKILKVMVIGAHMDDPDLLTGGLAIKLSSRGHKVRFVSVTNSNMGHHELGPIELAALELKESIAAAEALGAEFECLNIDDGHLYVNRENTQKVVSAIRRYDPDLVITHRPNDYHRDHRYTSQLVVDASYMLIVPHYFPDTPIPESRKHPIFMYAYDYFEKPNKITPNVMLDITDVNDQKAEALIEHKSQMMEWLPWTMNQEDLVPPDYDKKMQMEILQMLQLHVFQGLLSDFRSLWKKGFPGKKVKAGEIFEFCEYGGGKPTKEQLKEFFPGCFIPSDKEIDKWKNASLYKVINKLEKKIAKLEGKDK